MASLRQVLGRLSASQSRRLPLAVLALCLLAHCALQSWFIRNNSATVDEYIHISAAYRYWQCGEFLTNAEHPPLFKWVAGIPIRDANLTEFPRACGVPHEHPGAFDPVELRYPQDIEHDHPELLRPAREAVSVFGLILIAVVFFATRELFGDRVAMIAAVLCAFEPVLIAHGSLVTSDMPLATFMVLSVWMALRCVDRPTQLRTLAMGVALGLCLASKHSAVVVPFFLLLAMIALVFTSGEHSRKQLLKIGALFVEASVVGIVVLWAFYGFRYSASPVASAPPVVFADMLGPSGRANSVVGQLIQFCASYRLLPEAYLAGLATVVVGGARPAFLLGSFHTQGVWYYFPVALAIKLSVGVLALFAAGLATRATWTKHRRNLICFAIPFVAFFLFAVVNRLNIGIRHILPVVPLIAVVAAVGAANLLHRSRAWATVALALVCGTVASSLIAAPHQISYANELAGGPNRLHRYLGDSNVDWGQESRTLTNYLAARHSKTSEPCMVATGTLMADTPGCAKLPTFDVDVVSPGLPELPPESFSGTFVVQPLAGSVNSSYTPYMLRAPDEILGNGTILVFHGTFDFREIAATAHVNRAIYLFHEGEIDQATSELLAAEPNCPESRRVEVETALASLMVRQYRLREARAHAQKGIELAKDIATYEPHRVVLKSVLDQTALALGD